MSRIIPISKEERTYLRESGMGNVAFDRVGGLVRFHVGRNTGIQTLARDCYLQGLRDAADALDRAEKGQTDD